MTNAVTQPDFARLEVPARPEYVSVLRLVAGAASANHAWLQDERLDDLKLAISEACIALMSAQAESIQMSTTVTSSEFQVELTAGGAVVEPSESDSLVKRSAAFEYGTPLVSMLVDKVAVSPDATAVTLKVLRDPQISTTDAR